MLDRIARTAEVLDAAQGGQEHAEALAAQRAKVANPELTPSARVLAEMRERGESFSQFALRQSRQHADYFRSRPLDTEDHDRFEAMARQSLDEQARLEAEPEVDFDTFVAAYQASILGLISN